MSRTAYAIDQLISEVSAGYPDSTSELGEPDGLDIVRSVTFTGVPKEVGEVLNLVPDRRVASTSYVGGKKKQLTVVLQTQSTLADDRAPFGISATEVLTGSDSGASEVSTEETEVDADA